MYVTAAFLTRLGVTWLAANLAPAGSGLCRVELVPDDAPRAWLAAASAVRASLRGGGPADHDCQRVVIHASADRPSVEVTTVDGRRGERRLASAGDVEPTVAALMVTVLADPGLGARAGDATSQNDEATTTLARAPASVVASVNAGWRPQLIVGGGARVSLQGTSSPMLQLALGVGHPYWEAALYGAWAPTNLGVAPTVVGFKSTAEVGLGGARRQPLGDSSVDLVLGAHAGLIRLAAAPKAMDMTGGGSGDTQDPTEVVDLHGVAPAATAFLGAVFPTRAAVRIRPQIWFQWVPKTRINSSVDATARLASVGLSIAAESRLP